jgi:hypothetical protein
VTLSLARISFALDDLPKPLLPVHLAGYALLGTAGKLVSDLAERFTGRVDSGLTLLAEARRL